MYRNRTKLASALGAAGLIVLVLAGPAAATHEGAARNDIGQGPTVDSGAARNDVGQGPTVDVRRMLNDIDTPLAPAPTTNNQPAVVRIDDDAVELVQVVLGALAGAALTAAGVAALSARRRRGLPHPA